MELSGKDYKLICDALQRTFSEADLTRLVRYELDRDLHTIAGGKNMTEIVFSLVDWAAKNNQLENLVAGAKQQNPGNELLKSLPQSWQYPIPVNESNHPEKPLVIGYENDGRLDGDRLGYQADFAEAVYGVSDGTNIDFSIRFEQEDLVHASIAQINSETLTPEHRIELIELKKMLKGLNTKREMLLFALPFLFRQPLSDFLSHDTLVDAVEGLGVRLFDARERFRTSDDVRIDIWHPEQRVKVAIKLDAEESAFVAGTAGCSLQDLVWQGAGVMMLPDSALYRRAVPAILLELDRLHRYFPDQYQAVNINEVLSVPNWYIGLS